MSSAWVGIHPSPCFGSTNLRINDGIRAEVRPTIVSLPVDAARKRRGT
jgi:hypothetical protein